MSSNTAQSNREQLRALLRTAGVVPRRSSGQNFLTDGTVVADLIDAAHVTRDDTVLEIGPGLGAVTGELLERGASVIAIELDRKLASFLAERFRTTERLNIVAGDIRTAHLAALVTDGRFKVVASLPFNVTSFVLRRLLEEPPRPSVVSLVVQKEVAERITAPPGKMSLLSLAAQYFGVPSIVRDVQRTCFWPTPDVDAAIVRIKIKDPRPVELTQNVFRLARIAFSSRRKLFSNTLSSGLHVSPDRVKEKCVKIGLNPLCRPQEISVEQWEKMAVEIF
ncbi:MAG: 16S rRNA (adenine(1518)-N(6)/adenine(1519)-N(6))-dimethyltransferase RsmA [Candidatus Kerfeldbacteria bacterium]